MNILLQLAAIEASLAAIKKDKIKDKTKKKKLA